jgi:hypothetical protein
MSRSLWLLTWLICSSAQAQQLDARFTLVCRYGTDFIGYKDANFEIDATNQTVNQKPGTISEGEITTTQENESYAIRITINRYTGAMKLSSFDKKNNRNMPDISGMCVRPAERKF